MALPIRVGIVGSRFAARFHLEGYRRVYGVPVEVVGVTSKTAESREAFARERGLRAFDSLAALSDAADVVDICAPGSAHDPLAVEALYLKRVEGETRLRKPIRPATVSARTHEITRLTNFQDLGFLRTSYDDIEDYAQVHVTFDDGTVADIFSSELALGGVHNWLEAF